MRKSGWFLILIFFSYVSLDAQRNVLLKQAINVDTAMIFSEKLSFELILPGSLGRQQKVLERSFSLSPDTIMRKYNDSTLVALWEDIDFTELNISSIHIDTWIALQSNDIQSKRINNIGNVKIEDRDQYLNSKVSKKKMKLYKEFAESIKYTNKLDIVGAVYKNIIENFEPIQQKINHGTFTYISTSGNADNLEYTQTMAGVLRLKGIPVQINKGLQINADGSTSVSYWPEIFISDYGWFNCDPFYNDFLETNARMDSMANNYIVFTKEIEAKDFNYSPPKPHLINNITYTSEYSDETLNNYHTAYHYFSAKEYDNSISVLNRLIQKNPNYCLYKNLKAWNLFLSGESEEAIAVLKIAFPQARNSFEKKEVLYTFANIFGYMGDSENAYAFINEAMIHGYTDLNDFKTNNNFSTLEKDGHYYEIIARLEKTQ